MTSGVALSRLPLEGDGVIKNLYHFLWTRDELDCGPKVNIPDTVIYEFRQPATWYFTSKSGHIKKKSRYNLSNIRIEETFTRNALSSDIVASYLSTNAESGKTTIEYFDRSTLRDFLYNRDKVDNGILQKFVEPKGTRNVMIRGIWSPKLLLLERRENLKYLSDAKFSLYERAVTYEGPDHYSRAAPVRGSHLPLAIQTVCEDIVNHVAEVSFRKFGISRMAANFKVDGNDRVWFLWCSSLRLAQTLPAKTPDGSVANLAGVTSQPSSFMSSSFGMPPRQNIIPSSKGPVSLLPHCEVPPVVQQAFSTNKASRAAGSHLPLDEIRPPDRSGQNEMREPAADGRHTATSNLSESVVAIQTSTCRSCRNSVLMDRFYRVPYKTIVAHFEQFMTVIAANHAGGRLHQNKDHHHHHINFNDAEDERNERDTHRHGSASKKMQIEWPPSRELVKAVGGVGLGPLDDLRESIRTAKDRSKITIAQEDIEIPPIIRETHPHLAAEDYRRYRRDPMFLYKTSAVCEDCYLIFAQVANSAKTDLFAKELQRQLDDMYGRSDEDPSLRRSRLHEKNQRANIDHIERTSRNRRERRERRRQDRERHRIAQQEVDSLRRPSSTSRLVKMAGPSMPPRIDEKNIASISISKSEAVLELLQKREKEIESQLSPLRSAEGKRPSSTSSFGDVNDLSQDFQQELRERENAFFRDLYRNPNLEHGHPLSHMISSQAKVHITEAALTSGAKKDISTKRRTISSPHGQSRNGARGNRNGTRAFIAQFLSPRELESVDWSSPYVQTQVVTKPSGAGSNHKHKSPRGSKKTQLVHTVDHTQEERPSMSDTKSASEHRDFLLKTLQHVQDQLDNPMPLAQAVGLERAAQIATESVEQGLPLDDAWEARDRALIATPSNIGRVKRAAIHVGGIRMMAAVDIHREDMVITVFNPRISLSQKIEIPMTVVLQNAPESCTDSESLADFVLGALEPDTVSSLIPDGTPVKLGFS